MPSARSVTLFYFSSLPGLTPDFCLSVYFLSAPTEWEPHGIMDLLCPTIAVCSAARRVPNTERTQFIFVEYVFHFSYIFKLRSYTPSAQLPLGSTSLDPVHPWGLTFWPGDPQGTLNIRPPPSRHKVFIHLNTQTYHENKMLLTTLKMTGDVFQNC